MFYWVETPGKTQNMLERLSLRIVLEELEEVEEEERLGNVRLSGWMDGNISKC